VMPIYTYRCPRCEQEFDKRVSMAEMDEYQPCPGLVAEPDLGDPEPNKMPKLVQCCVAAKRLEVPSSPANFIMH